MSGGLFFRQDDGISTYDKNDGLIKYDTGLKGISDAFSEDNINFLIGTHQDCLHQWNRVSQSLTKISDLIGINQISYSENNIYVNTQDEVYRYHEQNGLTPLIKREDGLPQRYSLYLW